MKKRALVGSCGGLTGNFLARQLKKEDCYVVGADASPQNATKFFVDDFVLLPSINDPTFLSALEQILKEKQIDFYFPTHSKEIRLISQNEQVLRKNWNGNFIVSPHSTYLKLDNKRNANRALKDAGIPVPMQIDGFEDIDYPIFMKPDVGSGSRNAQSIASAILHREYARLDPQCTFYEFIKGTEYTVDCVFDESGKLLAYNQRIRVKNMGGAVIITQNSNAFDILPFLRRIEDAFLIKGCVNFQYILSDATPYFIDVNLRYASGGLPLTVASGINVPKVLLALLDGKPVRTIGTPRTNRLTMYRYFEEVYEEADT